MKRRRFLESISGIAVTSSVAPLIYTNTLSGLLYGCTAKTVLPPDSPNPTWLNSEPLRVAWFRLSPQHASSDPKAVIDSLVKSNFNCILNTAVEGGAYYPSDIPYNEPGPFLPQGGDFYGGVAAMAKQNNMRTGARFDFTQLSKTALVAHPEWFIRHRDESTVTDANGLSKPCLNSDFYHVEVPKIISEVLDRYEPDFIYINWFANFFANMEICHCESCQNGYRERYGKPLPDEPDADFEEFIEAAGARTASIIADTIYNNRPGTLYINADNDHADNGHHLETHQGDWIYSSSEHINRQRTSYPGRVGIDMWFAYTGDPSQFDSMLLEEMKVRYYQFGAHGSPLSFCTDGTVLNPSHQFELANATGLNAWHKDHADLYGLQQNLSRVLLLCEPEIRPRWRNPLPEQTNRGIYSMLTEAHIPVAVSENPLSLMNASQTYDLVIVTEGASVEGVPEYVEEGGRALFISQAPSFGIPSLEEGASLTFIHTFSEKPFEPIKQDTQSTQIPALIIREFGKGKIAFLPWDIGGFYTRELLPDYSGLFTDIVDSLLLDGRQIRTNAPASVEMVFMYQPDKKRTILHLVNCSGKTPGGFREPEIFHSIELDLSGNFSSARARVSDSKLEITQLNGRSHLNLPLLGGYEAIVLS